MCQKWTAEGLWNIIERKDWGRNNREMSHHRIVLLVKKWSKSNYSHHFISSHKASEETRTLHEPKGKRGSLWNNSHKKVACNFRKYAAVPFLFGFSHSFSYPRVLSVNQESFKVLSRFFPLHGTRTRTMLQSELMRKVQENFQGKANWCNQHFGPTTAFPLKKSTPLRREIPSNWDTSFGMALQTKNHYIYPMSNSLRSKTQFADFKNYF